MSDFAAVTDEQLALARRDPALRHKLLAMSLDRLLAELHKLQRASQKDPTRARQLREGVDLAVKLADLIRRVSQDPPAKPNAA